MKIFPGFSINLERSKSSKIMVSGRCAACRNQRRRCPSDCIFSPYFPSNNPQRFANVHKIYGSSNVGKLLQRLPKHMRGQAVETLCFEAECRIQDPVYGCVGIITQLHQELHETERELVKTQALIAFYSSTSSCKFNNLPTHESKEEGELEKGFDPNSMHSSSLSFVPPENVQNENFMEFSFQHPLCG